MLFAFRELDGLSLAESVEGFLLLAGTFPYFACPSTNPCASESICDLFLLLTSERGPSAIFRAYDYSFVIVECCEKLFVIASDDNY